MFRYRGYTVRYDAQNGWYCDMDGAFYAYDNVFQLLYAMDEYIAFFYYE
jgi:hypothetical protein